MKQPDVLFWIKTFGNKFPCFNKTKNKNEGHVSIQLHISYFLNLLSANKSLNAFL